RPEVSPDEPVPPAADRPARQGPELPGRPRPAGARLRRAERAAVPPRRARHPQPPRAGPAPLPPHPLLALAAPDQPLGRGPPAAGLRPRAAGPAAPRRAARAARPARARPRRPQPRALRGDAVADRRAGLRAGAGRLHGAGPAPRAVRL